MREERGHGRDGEKHALVVAAATRSTARVEPRGGWKGRRRRRRRRGWARSVGSRDLRAGRWEGLDGVAERWTGTYRLASGISNILVCCVRGG